MEDIFENIVICKTCGKKMRKILVVKGGFKLRAVECPQCRKRIYHPHDLEEFKHFSDLKNKAFKVKLRIVGNSYAVSIPKEIVEFMHEQEKKFDEMVRLCFEEAGKISLMFGNKLIEKAKPKEEKVEK